MNDDGKNTNIQSIFTEHFEGYAPSPADTDKIDRAFVYHPPIPGSGQAERYSAIRAKLKQTATFIALRCPPSRELSLCLTSLQEAMMWANASIACNETIDKHPGLF